jgi:hypothetical protein
LQGVVRCERFADLDSGTLEIHSQGRHLAFIVLNENNGTITLGMNISAR